MILIFDGKRKRLQVILTSRGEYNALSHYPAGNNVATDSRGQWPEGVYYYNDYFDVTGPDGDEDGKFGSVFFSFYVPGRSGMGLHAGRHGVCDGLGRRDTEHCTFGCIRTTEKAVEDIALWSGMDPIECLVVINQKKEG